MSSIANQIRKALARQEDMSLNEIVEQIDDGVDRQQVAKQLYAMKKTGELVVGVYEGACVYKLAEGYEHKRKPKDAPAPAKAKPAAKKGRPAKATKAAKKPRKATAAKAARGKKPGRPATVRTVRRPRAVPMEAPAAPSGMRDRLSAIAVQLQEVLTDACEARLSHELLTPIVAASGAILCAVQRA